MSAQDTLSQQLFHGTIANLKEGDIINPSESAFSKANHAWATSDIDEAHRYASARAFTQNALFGSVYEVEPLEDDKTFQKDAVFGEYEPDTKTFTSEKGFRVKKHVGWAS